MAFAIGVDLGGTNLRIAAVDENGTLLEKLTTGTKVALGRDAVIKEMVAAIQEVTNKFSPREKLLGVGIGVPGIIDQSTGMLRESPNLPGWDDYPVRNEIERRLGAPVYLENDANVAALGEAWLGAAKGIDDVCMITLGTGVGGGLVMKGRIWTGMTGMAGELGHITIDPTGPRCNCGNYGCAEQYASATAVMKMARQAIESGLAPELKRASDGSHEFGAATIFNLATRGDEVARGIYRKAGWALGILLADLINALNLEMYVIGGGVSGAWEAFAPAMFDEISRRSFVFAATADPQFLTVQEGASANVSVSKGGKKTVITRALMGSDAGLYGAARLAMLGKD